MKTLKVLRATLLAGFAVSVLSCEAVISLFSPPDRQWPTVTIVAPLVNQEVSGVVTIIATADDPGGIFRVVFYLDGLSLEEDRSSPYEFLWDTGAMSGGAHTLTAWAYDNAGNAAVSQTVSVIVKNFGGTYSEGFDGYSVGPTGNLSGFMPSDATWSGLTMGDATLEIAGALTVGSTQPALKLGHGTGADDLATVFVPIPRLRQGFLELKILIQNPGAFCMSLGSGSMEAVRTGFFLWFVVQTEGENSSPVWFTDSSHVTEGQYLVSQGSVHNLRILFDVEQETWDLLVDGVLTITDAPLVQSLEAVEFFSLTTMGLDTERFGGSFLVDDLSTGPVEGPENPASVDISSPVISPQPGAYKVFTPVVMSCTTPGVVIRYTIDGTDPTAVSPAYNSTSPPLITVNSLWKASAFKEGGFSPVVSAAYTVTPFYPGVTLKMQSGMRWNFHYVWRHWVAYSYSGDSSFTSESDLSFVLTNPVTIAGKALYQVAATGAQASRIKWLYLGCDEYRIYGSSDGTTVQILFDAQYGIWVGQSFFGNYPKGSALSLTTSGLDYLLYKGWRFEDNSSVYYPETGTIYDPDYYSGYSQTSEKYRSGVGPYYWMSSEGSTSTYEASSDTYTISLTSLEENVDIAAYRVDGTLSEDNLPQIFTITGSSGSFVFTPSNNYADYIFWVDLPDGGDPRMSLYSWKNNMSAWIEGQDLQNGTQEFHYVNSPGGKVTLAVFGIPEGGGRVRVCGMKVVNGEYSGQFFASIDASGTRTLVHGASRITNLPAGGPLVFGSYQGGYTASSFYFVIPLNPELDLRIALMKAKTLLLSLPPLLPDELVKTRSLSYSFSSADFLRYIDGTRAGKAEVLRYTGTIASMPQVWEDGDGDGMGELSGDLAFGWGLVP